MKVIAKDNLNRDFYPEKLISVSISNRNATAIAESLNKLNDGMYYEVVEDSYILNLSSMYDVNGDTPPEEFFIKQYGLEALFNISNMEYYKNNIKRKTK